MSNFIPAPSAHLVAWSQSPDGVSLIQIWFAKRAGRPAYLVRRANLAGEEVTTLAIRTTEAQARAKANDVWLADKGK